MKTLLSYITAPFLFYKNLYKYGFRTMSKQNRTLWVIGIIKLAIMFGILKIFFFKDFLKTRFENDEQRIEYLSKELTKIKK